MILTAAAAALGASFAAMAWLGDLAAHARAFAALFGLAFVAYGIAVLQVLRRPPARRVAVAALLAAGLGFRLLLVPLDPTLSTDLYRYVWDGRLTVAGVSPYRDAPSAPALAPFRDETVYPRLNHVDWRTIYPPGAQLLFGAVARLAPHPLGFKLAILLADLLAVALLLGWLGALGRPRAWALVYAWHPLVIVELAGSGHLDAVVLALGIAALWAAAGGREGWAGALVGVATLVKLYPALLLPAVWTRRPGRVLAAWALVVLAGYGLYAGEGTAVAGSLGRYVVEEEFNSGGLRLLAEWALGGLGDVGSQLARILPLLALAALAVAIGWTGGRWPPWQRARWLMGAYLVAVPNLFPWYAVWIVPVLAAAMAWAWLGFTGAVALTYLVFAEPVWQIPGWVVAAEWAPLLAGLGHGLWTWRERRPIATPGGSSNDAMEVSP